MQYENHMLENELLPFIFHYDIISDNVSEFNGFGNWHENPEFLYFTKGSGEVRCNDAVYHVQKGDLAVINSDCFHAVSSQDRIEYYCLIVDLEFFRSNGIPIDDISFLPIVRNAGCGKSFEALERLYKEHPELCFAKIRSEVLGLIIELAENCKTVKLEEKSSRDRVKDVVSYIKSNFKEHITIDDIVRHAGFSRGYLSRRFKKSTGVSLITYLNYVRCRHAKLLLGTGKVTVSAAALECGFVNLSYFAKTYRQLMGRLPSEELGAARENTDSGAGVNMKVIMDDEEFYM